MLYNVDIERIKWKEKLRNVEESERVGDDRRVFETIKKRKLSWIGQFLRKKNFLVKNLLEEMVKMGRKRRWRRLQPTNNLKANNKFGEPAWLSGGVD